MADEKKSFLVYCDLIHTVRKMKKEDVGELFLHLLEYTNDLNPSTDNQIVELVFEPIRQQLKRDLKSWELEKENSSIKGKIGNLKRWNNDLYLKYQLKEISLNEAENIAKQRKLSPPDNINTPPIKNIANFAVTDNVIVNVNDTVKVNDIYKSFLHLSITIQDFEKLKIDYEEKDILDCFDRIENYKENTKYSSLYLTSKQWLKKQKEDKLKTNQNGKSNTTAKPTYRNTLTNAFNNSQQTSPSSFERELSQDTAFTVVE